MCPLLCAVYDNRRRIRGEHGKELLRRRGEFLERSFAHAYETGGMRRTHLWGRENILKRALIHVGGFNLSLVMRQLLGKGTPRGLQGVSADAPLSLLWLGHQAEPYSTARLEGFMVSVLSLTVVI
jgi:hypothetical protein